MEGLRRCGTVAVQCARPSNHSICVLYNTAALLCTALYSLTVLARTAHPDVLLQCCTPCTAFTDLMLLHYYRNAMPPPNPPPLQKCTSLLSSILLGGRRRPGPN